MSWKYYRRGKLVDECNDLPETMEDAVIELQENGHDVSDCIVEVDDNWSPDYPSEEDEYEDTIVFKPLTDEETKAFKKLMQSLPKIKVSNDFEDKLFDRINKEHGVNLKPSRLQRLSNWWHDMTTGSKVYIAFWVIYLYLLVGLSTQEPRIVQIVCEIILWPFFM